MRTRRSYCCLCTASIRTEAAKKKQKICISLVKPPAPPRMNVFCTFFAGWMVGGRLYVDVAAANGGRSTRQPRRRRPRRYDLRLSRPICVFRSRLDAAVGRSSRDPKPMDHGAVCYRMLGQQQQDPWSTIENQQLTATKISLLWKYRILWGTGRPTCLACCTPVGSYKQDIICGGSVSDFVATLESCCRGQALGPYVGSRIVWDPR